MNKEVKYNGYSAVPSDYECQDGDLAVSINLIPEKGALKPILPPKVVKAMGENGKVAFIHETSAFTHYILYGSDSCIFYQKKDSTTAPQPIDNNNNYLYGVSHFNSVGNTLLAFTSTGIHYFLWKDNSYIYLGDHVPEIDVSFGLIGRPRLFSQCDDSKSTFTISFDSIAEEAINNEFTESNKTRITEQVMAKVNKFVREQTIEKGRFCFPFFVRYALRLFDGSLVNHSAPILMNPSTAACPVVFWKHIRGKKSYTEAELDIMMVASTLDYKILNSGDSYKLATWSDIVTGIEVFISKPIYTFDQDGKCSSWKDSDNFSTKFIGRLYATNRNSVSNTIAEDKLLGSFDNKDFLDIYSEWEYSRIYAMYFSADRSYPGESLHLPEFTGEKVAETIRNTSQFYKLRTIDNAEAVANRGTRVELVIEDEYLQSLVTREVMTDDYLTHDILAADSSYAYNNRLNLSGVSRKPFRGFLGQSMFAYCTHSYSWRVDGNTLKVTANHSSNFDMAVTVYIKENGKDYAVSASEFFAGNIALFMSEEMTNSSSNQTFKTKRSWGCYVFYPNVNAHKMLISNSAFGSYLISLRPHEFLNGAFAVLDYELVRETNYTNADLPSISYNPSLSYENNFIRQANKIYTSEVNNPFYFPLLGVNTIGTGEMLGICSAAKALSQGQFGQFPLYAFTTEGVWALEVSSTGTYTARQPITRDVCRNADGITQLDSAVLFPTDRGIMLISGSQTQCISDAINSEYPFNALCLPGFAKLHSLLGHVPEKDSCLPILPFSKFLRKCRMIYDYVHQRVIVYAPGVTYAYVFSLESKQWGMTFSNIVSHLNSYPEALAVDDANNIVNLSESTATEIKALFLTRPLKLDTPNVHKTIDTIIQRGFFRKGQVATALYGSRDLVNWHLVWSSKDHYLRGFRGTPYKYFRIAGVATLDADGNIFGASVQFTPRLTNSPR